MSAAVPQVSVLTATYQRSQVLGYAIRSVLRQTFTDWEQVIVGDACTDDTAAVVASFADARLRFENRAENAGEQSLPNNDAFRSSRGRLIAYLNHDDLWFPAHLERAVAFLEQSGADLVYTLMCTIDADGTAFLSGATSSGSYEPQAFLPASSWVLKRELLEEVGPWRPARRVYAVPSQEWLARAWRAGKKLRLMPHVTVVALPSGRRPGSYKQEGAREHAAIFGQMVDDPAFLERRLTEMALRHAEADPVFGTSLAIVPYLRRAAGNAVRRLLIAANRHPTPLMAFLRYGRRGGVIDRLRAVRGLPPLPRTGPAS